MSVEAQRILHDLITTLVLGEKAKGLVLILVHANLPH